MASPESLKMMSLEELMDLEVISVSRRAERLTEVASAIQVLTADDVRRSGASSVPEALRLAPNLRVAQLNSYGWVVSARGFSGLFANKLLVMIDGRTVYTPLFAGVLWDVQNVLLEDLDRIEVVSGPGGTLWGANAVNGVINILTKSARDTQGFHASAAVGSFLEEAEEFRYGGQAGGNLFFRIHGQRFERGPTFLPNGQESTDSWELSQGGARLDWYPSEATTLTLQGEVYDGTEHTAPSDSTLHGHHVLGRWTRVLSADSDLSVQLYYDRTWRQDIPSTLTDKLRTFDLDFQHRLPRSGRHGLLWGAGYRKMESEVLNSTFFVGFVPQRRDMDLVSAFVQDEVMLAPERLRLTLGTKLEHNSFTGWEVQPNLRLAWTPDERHTWWGAVSRAVRSPSRIDVDYHIPAADIEPGMPGVDGGPNFESEILVAYETGYRIQPTATVSLSFAGFYHRYDDVYSVEPAPAPPTYQIQNGAEGQSYGVEVSGTWQPATAWRLRGGYTYFHKDLWSKPGHNADSTTLGNDPKHQFLLQSILDLPAGFQLDVAARYTDALPNPALPSYLVFDARLAWRFAHWELSVVGQSLGKKRHAEFLDPRVPSGVYGKVTWRY